MKSAATPDPSALLSGCLENTQQSDARVTLVWTLAQNPELVRELRRPGANWVLNESSDLKLYLALQPFREACNAFLKGPCSGFPEPFQRLCRVAVMQHQLAYYWVIYDVRIRHLLWPYCEEWAVNRVQSETSLGGAFVRSIEADLRTCLLLETVGEHQDGYVRFGKVFLERFENALDNLFKEPDANSPPARQIGRDLSNALADYESWLKDPIKYAHLMPADSGPVDDMLREAQFLVQGRHRKGADLKWLNPWLRSWRSYYRVLGRGVGLKLIQSDGVELVQPFRGRLRRFPVPEI